MMFKIVQNSIVTFYEYYNNVNDLLFCFSFFFSFVSCFILVLKQSVIVSPGYPEFY